MGLWRVALLDGYRGRGLLCLLAMAAIAELNPVVYRRSEIVKLIIFPVFAGCLRGFDRALLMRCWPPFSPEKLPKQDDHSLFDRLHPHSVQAGGSEGGDRIPYGELPDSVQRLIERAKALSFEVVCWQRIRHLKGGGDRFSKVECLAIFQQAEQLGWGKLSENRGNPSWSLSPFEYPCDH